MMEGGIGARVRVVFAPRHVYSRAAMHSLATATGAVFAARMWGGSWIAGLAWYVALFIGAHVVMVPFLAAAMIARDRFERWIRSLVEEELIRFDLHTYERQLQRVFPAARKAPGDEE